MAESAADQLEVDVALDRERRSAVAKIVQTDVRKPGSLPSHLERLRDPTRVERATVDVREDEIEVLSRCSQNSPLKLLRLLGAPVAPRARLLVDRDRAATSARLRSG